ncbi:MAG: DUF2520 domain-containing protein [Crocinitomicaceae bacterium]|nr:DUF2520 domain-containing protein [Crocinitomicaceae bacterium]
MDITRINIIGAGNVANYLVHKLGSDIQVVNVYSRTLSHASNLATIANAIPIDQIELIDNTVDLNIICVKDDAVKEIIKHLSKNVLTVHTSGSLDISILDSFTNFGIIYPLQTISKNRINKIGEIPFLVEANNQDVERILLEFTMNQFSKQSLLVDSKTRLQIHIAAVIANNFTNYLLLKSEEILNQSGVDFQILRPLLNETINKAFESGPTNSQTGPAFRNDKKTIELHMQKLSDTHVKELYKLMTELIQKDFNV